MITFADGSRAECDFFGVADIGVLYIDFLNQTMQSVLTLLSDPGKVQRIIFQTDEETEVLEGFTVIMGLQARANGTVRASLRRPYVGE